MIETAILHIVSLFGSWVTTNFYLVWREAFAVRLTGSVATLPATRT